MKRMIGRMAVMSALLSVLTFAAFLSATPAQNKKKAATKRTQTKPKPQPTVPVVVKQAEQYTNQTQQIISGNTQDTEQVTPTAPTRTEPETTDEKLDKISRRLGEMNKRISSMESNQKNDYDEKQKRLLLNLDILTKAEQRVESLRKQQFDVVEKENTIKTRLEQLEFDLRPEMIDRQIAFTGTLRPEEMRELRRKNLDVERKNLQALLTDIQLTRANLELNVQKADQLVEKLRFKLEKDIDEALSDEPKP